MKAICSIKTTECIEASDFAKKDTSDIYETAGNYDYVLILKVNTNQELNDLLDYLKALPHVEETNTSIILKESKP